MHFQYLTDNCLSFVSFAQEALARIIQNVDPNKAYGDITLALTC